ncbi:lipopolysaccharide assembly protein LapA domain-containing protein [Spiribacter halobius]|uniref:DUF1049 domain-containing protein n=1 Tax=Sediminicurvatus halobius TaxID=2182432 RepID=A0A2U2N2P8_9GAMM|nr:lipopolysaccharide assembly protein LapA domain-containing protein [Spiribacter halobius]PWG63466.1 DUF1049 domain-containing protein [Spiribacter halobius]UEX79663.1 lipopolysaccharide assembly protein LapA domain-containing protein [Spiribacter halobius]
MRRLIALVIAVLVVALGLSFAMLNAESAELNFYFGQLSMPISLWMVIAVVVGAVLGVLSSVGMVFRQRRQLARLRRQIADAEKELSELRKLPIRNNP